MKRVLILCLLCIAATAPAGNNEEFIPAYNEIVKMMVDRYHAANRAINLPCKDPASSNSSLNSITQSDMILLRALAYQLMRDDYIAFDKRDPTQYRWRDAFPGGAANIMGDDIGRNGLFTMLPGKFATSGDTHYTDGKMPSDFPLLWIHFVELHKVLQRLKYSVRDGVWTANGEANYREGQENGLNGTFQDAQTIAISKWNNYVPVSVDAGPRAQATG